MCQYHLKKSEMIPREPYYVLGKSYPNGHAQIQSCGDSPPHDDQMKAHVIHDRTGQDPPPIMSLVIPSSQLCNRFLL